MKSAAFVNDLHSNYKKPECPKGCNYILYLSPYKDHLKPVKMVRLYIRVKGRYNPIGWICPVCGATILSDLPLKRFKTEVWPGSNPGDNL